MQQVKLSAVKKGEFIKRKADARKVYIRGEFDRTEKKYRCDDWDDISRDVLLKGETMVFVGFDF